MTHAPAQQVVALSTMAFSRIREPVDYLKAIEELGNPILELDFNISSQNLQAVLGEFKRGNVAVSSVHNCNPKFHGTQQRYNTGLADLDEDVRKQAVADFVFSLNLTAECGVRLCVGPLGRIEPTITEEAALRRLYREDRGTKEYATLREEVKTARARRVGPHMDAIRRSLDELSPTCERLGVRFAPENRYEFGKLGLPEEIITLRREYPDALGYCHDFGHAMSVDCLGLWPDEDPIRPSVPVDVWHVNDFEIDSLIDHLPLGKGDLSIDEVRQAVISDGSVAVVELRPHHNNDDIIDALRQVAAWVSVANGKSRSTTSAQHV